MHRYIRRCFNADTNNVIVLNILNDNADVIVDADDLSDLSA